MVPLAELYHSGNCFRMAVQADKLTRKQVRNVLNLCWPIEITRIPQRRFPPPLIERNITSAVDYLRLAVFLASNPCLPAD